MSYTNSTPNYALPQWIGTDKPTFLGDFNSAFSAIDTAMKNNADASSAATSTANAAQATAASANTNANTAISTANNAKDTADAATAAAASATSTANTAKNTADTAARAALANNIGNLAPAYDPTLTYAVGDIVSYIDENNTGKIYKCIIAVNSPMAFNVNYWDDVTATDIFSEKIIVKVGDYTTSDTWSDALTDIFALTAAYKTKLRPETCLFSVSAADSRHSHYRLAGMTPTSGESTFIYESVSATDLMVLSVNAGETKRARSYSGNVSGTITVTDVLNDNFASNRSLYLSI